VVLNKYTSHPPCAHILVTKATPFKKHDGPLTSIISHQHVPWTLKPVSSATPLRPYSSPWCNTLPCTKCPWPLTSVIYPSHVSSASPLHHYCNIPPFQKCHWPLTRVIWGALHTYPSSPLRPYSSTRSNTSPYNKYHWPLISALCTTPAPLFAKHPHLISVRGPSQVSLTLHKCLSDYPFALTAAPRHLISIIGAEKVFFK